MRAVRPPSTSVALSLTAVIPSRHLTSSLVFNRTYSSNSIHSTSKRKSEDYYERKSTKYWNDFYKRHQNKFFKDRHYLEKDWGRYFSATEPNDSSKVVLEVGCGAGNTVFPLTDAYPNLFVHACDFSSNAISLVKIFALSAVSPKKMSLVLQNLKKVIRPGGYVLFRDYAVGDFAQEKLINRNQMISENFCVRGDGTCAFYFSEDFLSSLFKEQGFDTMEINIYCKEIVNRSQNIVMDRRWMRAVFCNQDPCHTQHNTCIPNPSSL